MKKKQLLLIMLVLTLSFTLVSCNKSDDKKEVVTENGKQEEKVLGDIDYLEDDELFISLKDAFESVNGEVKEENEKVLINKDEDEIEIDLKNDKVKLNGNEIEVDDKDILEKDSKIFVSKNLLSKLLDARVVLTDEKIELRTKMPVEYARGFSVDYLKDGIKKVYLEEEDRTIILVPTGTELPEEYIKEINVNIPVEKAYVGSTIHGCDLRSIDELDTIVAVTSEKKTWQIDEVKEGLDKGDITFVGTNKAPDYEVIFKIKPDVAFLTGGRAANHETISKFDEINIAAVPGTSYYEEHPLGRMEWMKLTAAFYDKEEIVEELFNETVAKVNELEEKFKDLERPKVAWMRISKGEVTVPLSESYAAEMIKIAGGDYIFADENLQEKKISLEQLYDKGKDADIIIWEKMGPAPESVKAIVEDNPSLATMKAIEELNFWRTGDDYWQAIDKLDVMIESLAAIFHPEEFEGYEIKHFEQYHE